MADGRVAAVRDIRDELFMGIPIVGQRFAALLVKFCNCCNGVSPILIIIPILNMEYNVLSAVHLLLLLALVHRIRLLHIRDSW